MRGHFEGTPSTRTDDTGLHAVEFTATNGAFKRTAKLSKSAPDTVKIDGDEFVRSAEGLHIGPELSA